MNILILANTFFPQNLISAFRPTKLAKYLCRDFNCNVTVVRKHYSNISDIDSLYNKVNLINLPENKSLVYKAIKFLANKTHKYFHDITCEKRFSLLYNILSYNAYLLLCLLQFAESRFFYKKLKKIINFSDYDVILSSYMPFYPHLVAKKIKNFYPQILWVADYRDPLHTSLVPKFAIKSIKKLANKYTGNADIISVISRDFAKTLHYKDPNKIMYLPLGYDLDDLDNIKEKLDKEFLVFAYTGSFYHDKQDLSAFFFALNDLISKNLINKKKIKLCYAGRYNKIFQKLVNEHNFADNYINYGNVSHERSVQIQANSDILICASYNNAGYEGYLTGKFCEYLMIQKPILAFVNGNLPNSELKKIIFQNNLGFCYEYSNDKAYSNLLKFITKIYNEKFSTGIIHKPNVKVLEEFNYLNISAKLYNEIKRHIKED